MPSPLLDSFDPFAIHPFTNNCGVVPEPPSPSSYPLPLPSSLAQPGYRRQYLNLSTSELSNFSTAYSPQSPSPGPLTPIRSPQPQRHFSPSPPHSPTSPVSPTTRHIFVPFRKDTSSPDLVLKKKSPTRSQESSSRTK